MNINSPGKVKESIIKRSVLKNMDSVNNSFTKVAECYEDIEYAFYAAYNDYIVAHFIDDEIKNVYMSESIVIPVGYDETLLKSITKKLNCLAKENNVYISGGHTLVSEKVEDALISITIFAEGINENLANEKNNNQSIVMTAYCGIEGSAYLYENHKKEICDRIRNMAGANYEGFKNWLSIKDHVKAIKDVYDKDMSFMCALGCGGIYDGLYKCSEYLKCGIDVDLKKIPIRQETVEICNILDVNPYMMRSQGSVIFVTDNPKKYIDSLENAGIVATIIGKVTDNNDKIVRIDDEVKYIEPYKKDVIRNN